MQPSENVKEIIKNAVNQADDKRSIHNIFVKFNPRSAEIVTEYRGTTSSISYVHYADHIIFETFNDDSFLSEMIGGLVFWAVSSELKDPIKKHYRKLEAA